jgi:sec-independent protein translocase protein TatA
MLALAPHAEDTFMGDLFQPTHLLVIAIVLLVLFGAKRLPELGKGLGEGLKGFKEGLKGVSEPPAAPPTQQAQTPPPPPTSIDQKS